MGLPPSLESPDPAAQVSASLKTALDFGRLLNEARLLIRSFVELCAECHEGKIVVDDPGREIKKGEECPYCQSERAFLARCAKQLGPIIEQPETTRT
jgi:hypothetical protein